MVHCELECCEFSLMPLKEKLCTHFYMLGLFQSRPLETQQQHNAYAGTASYNLNSTYLRLSLCFICQNCIKQLRQKDLLYKNNIANTPDVTLKA